MDYTVDTTRHTDYVEATVRGDFVSVSHALAAWIQRVGPLLRTYVHPRLLIIRGAGALASPAPLCEIVIAI